MPRGALFTDVSVENGTCEEVGYSVDDGWNQDHCYKGMKNFFRNQTGRNETETILETALRSFGSSYNLSYDDVVKMDDCSCHYESRAAVTNYASCDLLKKKEVEG